jgi:hypothetical protein
VGIQSAGKEEATTRVGGGEDGSSRYKFELIELDPLSGGAIVHPLNGSVHCGQGCHSCDAATNSANADVIPAGSSPTGEGASLLFTVQCECPTLIGPDNWLLQFGPPKLVVVDVAQLHLTELQTLPATTFNFVGLAFSASGWDARSSRAVAIGMHAQNGTSPFSNSTMVFASVDLGTNATTLVNGTSQCGFMEYAVPGCQGHLPVEAVGTMAQGGGTWLGIMNFAEGHRMGYPASLVGTDVASGKITLNVSWAVPFYTMSRSPDDGDIVGLGLWCVQ